MDRDRRRVPRRCIGDSHRYRLHCEQAGHARSKDPEPPVQVDAVCRDQACLRVVQGNPHGRDHAVQMWRQRQGRKKKGEDVESVARNDCVHGGRPFAAAGASNERVIICALLL